MGSNTYFISDAHLGARHNKEASQTEKALVRWLDSIAPEAAAVYMLGDMFDYWFEYRYVVPRGFTRFLGKIAEMSDSGVEIHFFTGNHDIWMFDYLTEETGAIIHRDLLPVEINGKSFLLGHGDEVDYRSLTFRFLRSMFRNPVCQWLYGGIHPRWTFGFAHRWSHSSRINGLKNTGTYNSAGEDYLKSFACSHLQTHPGTNFYIFGHIHTMLDHELAAGSRLIILGDWIRHFSYAVWDGKELSLRRVPDIALG
jgi:UDP-2,3-diacylglucosamine hydrolase